MTWKPNSDPGMARARAALLRQARAWFDANNVLEVVTPVLGQAPVTEPAIDSIGVTVDGRPGWLQTSPEYFMKRLLAAGFPDIYQVCPVFRNGEIGRHHVPEFTMIEWYRLGFDLGGIIEDAFSLTAALLAIDSMTEPSIVEYAQVFSDVLAVDALAATPAEIADALDADASLRADLADDRDAWLDLAMATRVCRSFPADRLTAVRHYPASQASLARHCPSNPAVADRFEIYLGPIELANGFVELTDPDEQLRRFNENLEQRAASGKPVVPIDEHLIAAMRDGLPPCAGVALGFDRVLMIAEGRDNIVDVLTFTPGPVT